MIGMAVMPPAIQVEKNFAADYQTSQRWLAGRTIGASSLQPNVC